MYISIVYTQQGSIAVLCCVSDHFVNLCVFQLVCLIDNTQRTVTVYRISGTMASGTVD